LSTEEPGINRPRARAQHGQAQGQYRKEGVNPDGFPHRGIGRQHLPGLSKRSQTAGERRPQTGEQKDACPNRGEVFRGCDRASPFRQERDDSDADQSGAEANTYQKQPGSRPTIGKGGEQTLHSTTRIDRNESRWRSPPLKEGVRIPRSRDVARL
jgi:hypothetical protein